MVYRGRTTLVDGIVTAVDPRLDGTAVLTIERPADNGKVSWYVVVRLDAPADQVLGRGVGYDAQAGVIVFRAGHDDPDQRWVLPVEREA